MMAHGNHHEADHDGQQRSHPGLHATRCGCSFPEAPDALTAQLGPPTGQDIRRALQTLGRAGAQMGLLQGAGSLDRRPDEADGVITFWLPAGAASETQELCTKKTGSCAGTDFAQQPSGVTTVGQCSTTGLPSRNPALAYPVCTEPALARLRGLGHFRGFGPLKINELIKKVFTTAGAGARATEWNLGRDLDIADQRELAEGACERQSDTFRISWQ